MRGVTRYSLNREPKLINFVTIETMVVHLNNGTYENISNPTFRPGCEEPVRASETNNPPLDLSVERRFVGPIEHSAYFALTSHQRNLRRVRF